MDLTLSGFEALEERRVIAERRSRFNAALVTSAILNANRAPDSEPLSPFDFLPGYEEDPEDVERRKMRQSVKHAVALAFAEMRGKSREDVLAERGRMIERMTAAGVEDAEEIIREVYPDL